MDFECDIQSKYDFSASTVTYLSNKFPNADVRFYGVDSNGNMVDWDSASVTSHLDIYMLINNVRYACELKERWGKYHSTYYGEPDNEGWIYNIEKDNFLKQAAENGDIPLYVNLYPDDKIRIWNINKITDADLGRVEKYIHKYTVKDSPRLLQKRYTLMNDTGIIIDRIRADV